jgi:hypothetical protein
MAAVKAKVGTMPCPCCGHPLMVKANDAGTMTLACDGCDLSAYAKKGTLAQTIWAAAVGAGTVPKEDSQEPVKPAPVVLPAPAPAPVTKAKPFDPLAFLSKGVA